MKTTFHFKRNYFLLFLLLFIIEALIAIYVRDRFFRPHVGDFLVVIMIYCFVRSIVNASVMKAALGVLLFSFVVEFLQYLNFIQLIGLRKSVVASTAIGQSFDWWDMLTYVLGVVFVLVLEARK